MNEATPIPQEAAPTPIRAERRSDREGRVGVLLVNLGTPDAAEPAAVRRYLKEFLVDPRVIEDQGLLWTMVLNGIILRTRPRRKARDYRKIWNWEKDESPIKTITRAQSEKLGSMLQSLQPQIVVEWAMRYGQPSIAERLAELTGAGCTRILVVPLYPQYCAATTATVCDEVFRALARLRHQPSLRVVPPYYDEPVYIEALASSIGAARARLEFEPELILASFHGLPKDYVDKGDPYYTHCIETVRLLREQLALDERRLIMTFQSRFGRAQWLEPATDRTVKELAGSGVKSIAVITPGFSADCLETLEEIAVENAHIFKSNGGRNFAAIPCLNDSAAGMQVIRRIVLHELAGWI